MDYNSFLETASETATRLARVSWGLLEQKAWKRQSMSSNCPILALTEPAWMGFSLYPQTSVTSASSAAGELGKAELPPIC